MGGCGEMGHYLQGHFCWEIIQTVLFFVSARSRLPVTGDLRTR
jgi:hypothetical protein